MTTITAIATALSPAGIAIIRLSGSDCVPIADRLFVPRSGGRLSGIEPRRLVLGTLSALDARDECLAVRFAAPHSYTGEDVVEFQIHGGVKLAERALDACIAAGARMAEAGEFTRRAFLNGRLTLAQAEGVADTINAASDAELRASYSLVSGALGARVGAIRAKLVDVASSIEVAIDYPEEDLEIDTADEVRTALRVVLADTDALLATRRTGMIVKDGLNVALVGKPNVGKSSLLNALLGVERAIVTDVAGTTRDHITESMTYRGIRFNFIDTAGLRDSDDTVEAIGIERSRRIAESADVVIALVDDTYGADDRAVLDGLRIDLTVANKADLDADIPAELHISCKTGAGLDALKERLYSMYVDDGVIADGVMLTNARHYAALTAARICLLRALDAPALDLIPVDLRDAVAELGKIDGTAVASEVTDSIFAKFCLGK